MNYWFSGSGVAVTGEPANGNFKIMNFRMHFWRNNEYAWRRKSGAE
jgi:hypothetical protein